MPLRFRAQLAVETVEGVDRTSPWLSRDSVREDTELGARGFLRQQGGQLHLTRRGREELSITRAVVRLVVRGGDSVP
jgi:hypothetical protein